MLPVPLSSNDDVLGFMILPAQPAAARAAGAPAPIPMSSRVVQLDDRIVENLTHREREVLACVVEGCDARTIAQTVGITHATARNYVQRILTKLGARNKAEAVNVALRYNLIAS
jgi:DNA-binding NarL/FixJ family response regulator